jgi:alpha-tubulin suppressor-like RCC1 family protein
MNHYVTRYFKRLFILGVHAGAFVTALAQWSVTAIHPSASATASAAYGGAAGQQVGYVTVAGGYSHAAYWSGSAGSLVDLDPTGTFISYAFASNGTQQAGMVNLAGGWGRATLWSGTPESAVSLHPAAYARSSVSAMTATQQGGFVDVTLGTSRAALWSGTEASFVDLHPAGYISSQITAMAGSQQAGFGQVSGGSRRALLWNGSASNVVNLHASGPTSLTSSAIYAMTATQQGGTVNINGGTDSERAAIWSGTADSRVDLHPATATSSRVLAMVGNFQAGQVNDQAAVWQGTAASWVNLHTIVVAQLGSNYTKSSVRGAYQVGSAVYLVGFAQDTVNNRNVAVMWVPEATVAPSVVTQPANRVASAGTTATFSVVASGTAPLTYVWRKGGVALDAPSSPTLTLSNLVAGDAGSYDVVISNSAGSATSVAALLTVTPLATGGARRVVAPGEDLSLSVVTNVTGTATYQWYHDFLPVMGATQSTLLLPAVSSSAGGHYQLAITDDAGTRRSAPIFVTVVPLVTELLAWGSNYYGESTIPAGLTEVIATASGSLHSLALKRDGTVVAWGWNSVGQANVPAGLTDVVAIAAGSNFSMALKADGSIVQWGLHTSTLVPVPAGELPFVEIAAGETRAVALRSDGRAVVWGASSGANYTFGSTLFRSVAAGGSHTVALTQTGLVVVDDEANNIVTAKEQVPAGLSGVVAIAAAYDDILALKSDGTVVAWGTGSRGVANVPGNLSGVAAIDASGSTGIALRGDGSLVLWGERESAAFRAPFNATAIVSLDIGTRGDSVLAVKDGAVTSALPSFYLQPRSVSGTHSSSGLAFFSAATGIPAPSYRWQRLPAGGAWTDLADGGIYSGTSTATLALSISDSAMNGDQFRCVATNSLGSVQSTAATLNLVMPLPEFYDQPRNRQLLVGGTFTLESGASSPVPVTYQWFKNDEPIAGATAANYTLIQAQRTDSGLYRVVATNAGGSTTSNTATVVVTGPPVITTQPVSQTVIAGTTLTLSVVASSDLPLSYTWTRIAGSVPVSPNATCTIYNITQAEAGSYRVQVSNGLAYVTSEVAVVTVLPAATPEITQNPVDQSTLVGEPVEFTVAATGDPAPGYQWQVARTAAPNAWIPLANSPTVTGANTATLRLSSPAASEHGFHYRCVATNSEGTATSSAARLNVFVPGITKLAAGRYHSVRLDYRAHVWASGQGSAGQLGHGATTSANSPQAITLHGQTVVDVASFSLHTLFLTSAREMWATGNNATGQLGDGTLVNKTAPVKIATGVAGIAAGFFHTAYFKTDGTLWTVGGNDSGQLGTGDTTDRSSPVQIATDVVDVSAGIRQTLFIKTDGTLWVVGNRDGSDNFVSTPVQIASGVKTVSAGGYHALFVKTDGSLWSVGYNASGQLGDGTTISRLTPQQIDTDVRVASAGYFHSTYIKNDLSLWATGGNGFGQLGTSHTNTLLVPARVASDVVLVSASEGYSVFTKQDGSLWGAGLNANGQFGNGTTTTPTSPVQIQPGVFTVPVAPTGLVSTHIGSTAPVRLVWQPVPDATHYEVWRNPENSIATATRVATGLRWAFYEDGAPGQASVHYWIKAVNLAGSSAVSGVTNPAGLEAQAPQITTPPQSQSVSVGGAVSFSVVATGEATLSYQWHRNGEPLPGATSATLTLDPVIYADRGDYRVVVTNTAGSVTSDIAVLSVNKLAQTITFAAPADRAFTATPFALSATASSGLPVSFTLVNGPATLASNTLTLTGPGTVVLRAEQAGDATYAAASAVERSFVVTANFTSWLNARFTGAELLDSAISGSNADPDGDGLSNFLEYALGHEPRTATTADLPEVGATANAWTYTYTRPADRAALTYVVETSTDLVTWTTSNVTHELVSTTEGRETWRASVPLTTINAYFRLKVTQP